MFTTWVFPKIRVPPKLSILIGFSIINHPFWGTTIFGNIQMHLGFSQSSLCSCQPAIECYWFDPHHLGLLEVRKLLLCVFDPALKHMFSHGPPIMFWWPGEGFLLCFMDLCGKWCVNSSNIKTSLHNSYGSYTVSAHSNKLVWQTYSIHSNCVGPLIKFLTKLQ